MRTSSLLALIVGVLLSACATKPFDLPTETLKSVSLAVGDREGNVISTPVVPRMLASFPLITGSLAGKTSSDAILMVSVDFSSRLELSLTQFAALIAPRAAVLSEQARLDGVVVAPEDTHLARVGTFFARHAAEPIDMGAGFVDEQTREVLFLVYFDRPCTVTGTIRAGTIEIKPNFAIPSRGMHWLRVKKPDPKHWVIELAHPQTPVSLVTSGPL